MPSSKKRKLTVHGRKRTHPATSEDDMVPDLNSGAVPRARRTSKESIPSRSSTGNPFFRKLKHSGASGSSSSKHTSGEAQASSSRGITGASASGHQEAGGSRDQSDRNRKDSNRKSTKHQDSSRIIADLKQKVKKIELERSKMEAKLTDKKDELSTVKEKLDDQTKQHAKTKKEKEKLKRTSERLQQDKEQLEASSKKFKKKMESYRTKLTEAETENNKLSARIARLELESKKKTNTDASCVPGTSSSKELCAGGATGEPNLFQDMMDNFRELAETQLQCVICSELLVETVSINCGHSFCDHCIHEWKRKKNNCPVCRTTIKSINPVKILDEYADKVYEQFVGEGARQTRGVLKEERAKLKKESELARRADLNLAALRRPPAPDSGSESDDDSDTTLEIRFNSDLDSDVSDEIIRYFSDTEISDIVDIEQDDQPSSPDYRRHINRLLDSDPSSYDSTDSDFSVSRVNPNRERQRRIRSSDSESSSSSASSRSVGSPTSLVSDVDTSSSEDSDSDINFNFH